MAHVERVTVGIVGGGVAGLTLAKTLELLGIKYILWEARETVVGDAGAGVGLMPNGMCILDQLGLMEEISKYEHPHQSWEYRDADGSKYTTLTAMETYGELFGYHLTLMERQQLLDIIFQSVNDKTKIQFSKRVTSVTTSDASAIITAEDGSQVECDFVAGADGVKSVVRDAIERQSLNFKTPPNYLDSRFACVYGTSYAIPQIGPGRAFTLYRPDESVLVFSGAGSKLFWFLFIDLKETIPRGQSKRCTAQDLEAACQQMSDVTITADVKFADVYANKKAAVITQLEEGVLDTWHAGRIFVLGDAAHKMLPHNAMGASQAMESAVCFVNQLVEIQRQETGLSDLNREVSVEDAQLCLEEYSRIRKKRIPPLFAASNLACRNCLKIGSVSESHLAALVKMSNEDFLAPRLIDFGLAESLRNWPWNSERVELYMRQAQRTRKRLLRTSIKL